MYNAIEVWKSELGRIIKNHSFAMTKDDSFRLASGKMSKFYFNCKMTTLNGRGMVLIGNIIYSLVKEYENIQGIGGLTLGADAIATATSYTASIKYDNIYSFIVRKATNDHGAKKIIEGPIKEGDNVIVVDDVITTGTSTITAIKACKSNGLNVDTVITLIDREEENGRDSILGIDGIVNVISLFTPSYFI